ncbi:MAG: hypothetical protein FD130_1103, partial [Halothiobacillaceae bacterium]
EFINRKVTKEATSLLPKLALGPRLQQGYRALLSSDGELSLTTQPVAPIPMAKFQSPNPIQWLKLLNLNVSVNGRAINNVDLQYHPASSQQFSQRLLATLPSLRSYADELTGQPIQEATPPPQNRPSESPPVKLVYTPINLDEIANHIGTSIRIKTREGLTREGRLTEVTEKELVISWLLPQGEVTAFVTFDEIDNLEIPQQQPAIQRQ